MYLFTKIGKKMARWPVGTRAGPLCNTQAVSFERVVYGLQFDENAGRIGNSLFEIPAPVRVVNRGACVAQR